MSIGDAMGWRASPSALIKALRAPLDPPQAGWPLKVEIALSAWNDQGFHVPRKAEVIKDWILDSWTRKSGGILDPAYHSLLVDVMSTGTEIISLSPSQILTSFLIKAGEMEGEQYAAVLEQAARSLPLLYRAQASSTKLETWADLWTVLVSFLAKVEGGQASLKPIVDIVTSALMESEIATVTIPKKVGQAAATSFSDYCVAYLRHTALRTDLSRALAVLAFSEQALQAGNALQPLLAGLDTTLEKPETLEGFLLALPELFETLLADTHKSRFSIFTQASSSKVAHDVFVSAKERDCVLSAVTGLTDYLNGKRFQTQPSISWLWQAKSGIWAAVENWGGYVERNDKWGQLVTEEARKAESMLAECASSADAVTLVASLLRTLSILERLDHDHAQLGADVVRWCLASPSAHHDSAATIISLLLRFAQLTHTLPKFFDLLLSSLDGLFAPDLPDTIIQALYRLSRDGPLFQSRLRSEMIKALRSTHIGKRRGVVWTDITSSVLDRIRTNVQHIELTTSKKRKRPVSVSADRSAMVGILSRLFYHCLEAARSTDDPSDSQLDVVAQAMRIQDWWLSSIDPGLHQTTVSKPSAKGKNSKSGLEDWPASVSTSSSCRIIRAVERLTRRKTDFSPALDACSTVDTTDDRELHYETIHFLLHRAALDRQLSGVDSLSQHVDGILDLLASSTRAEAQSERIWQLLAEDGLLVLVRASTGKQLQTLASLLFERAVRLPCLLDAHIWEIPELKDAVQVSASTGSLASITPVLQICPNAYLDRKVKTEVISRAIKSQANRHMSSWLHRLILEGESLSTLGRMDDLIQYLVATDNGDEEASLIWRQVIKHLLQTNKYDLLTKTAMMVNERMKVSATHNKTAVGFCEEVMRHSKESFPETLQMALDDIGQTGLRVNTLVKAGSLEHDHDAVTKTNVLTRYIRWTGQIDHVKSYAMASQLCKEFFSLTALQSAEGQADVMAKDIIDTLAAEQAGTRQTLTLAAALLKTAPEIDIAYQLRSGLSDRVSEALGLCAVMIEEDEENCQEVSRIATALISICKDTEAIRRVIRAMFSRTSDPDIWAELLKIVAEHRPLALHSDHIARLWSTVMESGATSHSLFLDRTVAIIVQLSRRRPELLLATLPEMVDVLAYLVSTLRSKRTDSPDTDLIRRATALGRSLTALTQMRQASQGHETSPIAKHAPVVLLAYVRAGAGLHLGLHPAVRKELEPGIHAFCNLVTSGGRIQARGREGEGLGTPFGLGDGPGGEGEKELWAEMWRSWGRSRYMGQG